MKIDRLNEVIVMMFNEVRDLTDEGRDYPILWNVMHMFSSSQLAKILALRRGLDVELASIAALLHDIAVIVTKKSAGHAEKAEKYVRDILSKYNEKIVDYSYKISGSEEDILVTAIMKHSDKETDSGDPFIELLKDIDSIDRYLHGVKTEGAYLERCTKVLKELGIEDHLQSAN